VGVLEVIMGLLKWVIVVACSLVGGYLAGLMSGGIVSLIFGSSPLIVVAHLVTWIVSGTFIWMRLVKLMNLRGSIPAITEDREDK